VEENFLTVIRSDKPESAVADDSLDGPLHGKPRSFSLGRNFEGHSFGAAAREETSPLDARHSSSPFPVCQRRGDHDPHLRAELFVAPHGLTSETTSPPRRGCRRFQRPCSAG
jgi:hypothetical protein